MPIHKAPNAEPIRGYRLLEPLGRGGFGEVWKCEAPGGICKAIKFVYGDLNGLESQRFHAEEELRAFQLIKSIRHPFLLSIDRVEIVDGELLIISELADCSLHDLRLRYQAQGQGGIPRDELLAYLREAAEVLDLMNQKFDLQHLDIKPRNLFLVSNHVKVADFGLVNRLSSKEASLRAGGISPLYAAPELFSGKLSRHCDQYSLAIVFQELLTGTLPFRAENARQLMMLHLHAPPDVAALSEEDRAVVAKALAKNPTDRFPSCLDFLRALEGGGKPKSVVESALEIALARQAEAGMAAGGDSVRWPPPKNERVVPLPAKLTSELRIAECVATGPLEEIWQAVDVNNRKRLVKIVYGLSNHAASVRDAVEQLKAIHHPALVTQDVVLAEPGRMVIVTDAIKETLRDCFYQCRKRKQPGIVRPELIEYLRAAAEVLDYLYQQYGLFHGCLHPRQFVLDHGWLQLADFGIAQLFWQPGGQDVATYNARYAAPEQYHQTAHRNSDQYALALIYAEMLTGFHPFHCRSAAARHGVEPDLERLPPVDREVIARALSYDPNKRWPNCTAMMLALEGTSVECLRAIEQDLDPFARLIEQNKNKPHDADIVGTSPGDLNRLVHDIITSTAGDTFNDDTQLVPTMADDHVEQSFCIGLPIGTARSRLHGLAQRWFGQVIRDQERILVFRLSLPASFWRQLLGRRSGIEVRVELSRIHPRSATPIRVTVRAELLRKRDAASRELLAELAPQIIAELQQVLGTDADKRVQDRLLWPHPLKVTPILADGTREEPIECRGKDISKSGIGFYLPHDLATTQVLIELPNDVHPPSIAIPATLVRAKRCADGWYEVGALFRFPALRKSYPQIILPVTHARCPA